MSKESPGTAGDLSGSGEHMQKPHVEQPSVNSGDAVNLAGERHFWWQSQPEDQLLQLLSSGTLRTPGRSVSGIR